MRNPNEYTIESRPVRQAARWSLAITTAAAILLSACGKSEPETLPAPPAPATQPGESATAVPESTAATQGGNTVDPGSATTAPTKKPARPKPATPKPTTQKPATKKSVLPADLVGAWRTVTESGSAFSYEFTADGKYLYNGIMQDGDLRYTLQEGGRASIAATMITFRPQQTVMTRTENGVSTKTTPQRGVRRATFEIDGNTLTFSESDGSGSVYERG
jgi:hypothetical protein